jgi:DNA-binding IclR family transcriptional regulator
VISLSGPRERFRKAEIAKMKRLLGPAAEQLTNKFGGIWPVFRR